MSSPQQTIKKLNLTEFSITINMSAILSFLIKKQSSKKSLKSYLNKFLTKTEKHLNFLGKRIIVMCGAGLSTCKCKFLIKFYIH